MPTPGYVFRDGQPIPDSELAEHAQSHNQVVGERPVHTTAHDVQQQNLKPRGAIRTADHPDSEVQTDVGHNANKLHHLGTATDSHALALADHGEKGAAQLPHTATEVRDLGWDRDPAHIPKPLVGGLANEDIWLLIRRFDKQMYHVKAMKEAPLSGLDVETAEEDEFSPDKLRANVERLYMTVIVGLIGFGKHVARLRSWREPRRTGGFLAVSSSDDDHFMHILIATDLYHRLVFRPTSSYLCYNHPRSDSRPSVTLGTFPIRTVGPDQP